MEQLVDRGFFEHVEHPVHGDSVHRTFPFRLPGETGPVHRRPAPLLGEHNDEVFGDLLGLSADELAHLARGRRHRHTTSPTDPGRSRSRSGRLGRSCDQDHRTSELGQSATGVPMQSSLPSGSCSVVQ